MGFVFGSGWEEGEDMKIESRNQFNIGLYFHLSVFPMARCEPTWLALDVIAFLTEKVGGSQFQFLAFWRFIGYYVYSCLLLCWL